MQDKKPLSQFSLYITVIVLDVFQINKCFQIRFAVFVYCSYQIPHFILIVHLVMKQTTAFELLHI